MNIDYLMSLTKKLESNSVVIDEKNQREYRIQSITFTGEKIIVAGHELSYLSRANSLFLYEKDLVQKTKKSLDIKEEKVELPSEIEEKNEFFPEVHEEVKPKPRKNKKIAEFDV